jgi:hypothetical protein
MRSNASHENFQRDDEVKSSSNRQFGLVFAVLFGLVAAWPLLDGRPPRWGSLVLAGIFLILAVALPGVLAPLNRIWFRIGLALHSVVSPIVLGLVFFTTVTPIGLVLRLLGKDPLRRRPEPDAVTYWIERTPPGPSGDSMPRQF